MRQNTEEELGKFSVEKCESVPCKAEIEGTDELLPTLVPGI
jgi:hypothetical protein